MHPLHPFPRLRSRRGDGPRRGPDGPWLPPFGGGPAFGPHGHGRGRGGGRRARRGNVRAAILALLTERPMHGYEMISELARRTGDAWRPSPGALYPAVQLLEDEGLVTIQEVDGKRLVSLTDAGREEAERLSTDQAPWDEVTEGFDPAVLSLREGLGQVAGAVFQVGSAGSAAQKAAAAEILKDARRKLYSLLAEDE